MKRQKFKAALAAKEGAFAFLLGICVYIILIFLASSVFHLFFAGTSFPPLLKYCIVIVSCLIGPYFFVKQDLKHALAAGLCCGILLALVFLGFAGKEGFSSWMAVFKKSAFVILMSMAGAFFAKIKNGFSF